MFPASKMATDLYLGKSCTCTDGVPTINIQHWLFTYPTTGRRRDVIHLFYLAAPCLFLFVIWPTLVNAGELKALVTDVGGAPIANAIVLARPIGEAGAKPEITSGSDSATVTIAQQNQQFVPFVTAIQAGTAVAFPNLDNILHNVYSFSNSKKFKLPLYRDQSPPPIVFDKPGTVILGCNIHDWMVAYVFVLDTPHFGKSGDEGVVELNDLPAGNYEIHVYHPRKRKRGSTPMQVTSVAEHGTVETEFAIALKPDWRLKSSSRKQATGD